MKKIYLFCAAGMSTSVLVKKMQEAAEKENYACEIIAYPVADVSTYGPEADIILLGPQVRYETDKVKKLLPDKIVEAINMQDYGLMRGNNVLKTARERMGDL